MRAIRYFVLVSFIFLTVGCDVFFDEDTSDSDYNLAELTLNRIDSACLNDWDDGFSIGDYYAVFSVEESKDLLIYGNKQGFEECDGFFVACDSTGKIKSLGTTLALYNVEIINDQIKLWTITNDNHIEEYLIPITITKATPIDYLSVSNISQLCNAISNAVAGGVALNQLTKGDWNGLFNTLKEAGIDFTVGQLLQGLPVINIAYIYGKGVFQYLNWNEARRQRPALYSSCRVSITEAHNDSQGDCLVYVDAENIESIAPYLFNFYNKEVSESNRNKDYCGVVVRRLFTPTYHNNLHISSLKCLNEQDSPYGNNASLMFSIPALTQHIYELRPFLISSRVFDDNNDIREEYILYGNSFTYCPSEEYKELKQIYESTNGQNWTNNDNWLTDKPIGDWYGLTLTEDGYVKSLDLQDNNLTGSFHMTSLKEITNINLNNNKLEDIYIETQKVTNIEFEDCIIDYGDLSTYGPDLVTIRNNKEMGSLFINCETLIVDNCNFGEVHLPFSGVNSQSVLITNSTMYNCGLDNDYLTFENSKTTDTWYCNTKKQAKLINSYCSVVCSWDFSESATIIVSNTTLFQPNWNEKKTGTYSFTTNSSGWYKMFE